MRRDQLEHAIRTACQIIERPEVIVVGSQAILGCFREDELPADATMYVEVDILPIANSNDETARLADLIEGVAGEFSTFEELHGFSIDGVDLLHNQAVAQADNCVEGAPETRYGRSATRLMRAAVLVNPSISQ
jgi:hypothetical protein